jgi:prepilin-type N-terminal cleavage/methylation domain-containing protein
MRRTTGFTLIELLIVVAIIAILAAIAVPNFLEAQTRSKVSRVKADMRSIATAIESYAVDNTNKYPWVNRNPGYALPAGKLGAGVEAIGITTPIAYLTSTLLDPFGNNRGMADDPYSAYNTTKEYWYWTEDYVDQQPWGGPGAWRASGPGADVNCKWVLESKGPDQYWAHNFNPPGVEEVDRPLKWHYDPTNGTISLGNIVRCGP